MREQLDILKNENERLLSILQISQSFTAELDLELLLKKISDVVRSVLRADRCTVFLYDSERNELWSKVATGIKNEIRFSAELGLAGYTARTGEVLNIPDAYADTRFNPEIDKKTGYRTETVLTIPLRDEKNEITGVFQVLNKKNGQFTEEDEKLLGALASTASTAIENSKSYEDLHRSFISFIETLSTTLDSRDYITSGHSRRVTLYSVQIAQLMKLNRNELDLIRFAALLHDIGKLGIPEMVLFKNKRLSEDEYEIIKRHASLSHTILNKIHFQKHLKDLPKIAASHHEKIDGKGYPKGLKGDQIPLGGKIIAVCDVFDALTSRKQYSDRLDIEKVIEILESETGTSFEPYVVYQFKNIPLNILIEILEFGHHEELIESDLRFLSKFTMKDLLEIRRTKNRTAEQRRLDETFIRYYSRKYRK
ncbi:MAG: HD domain-containing protein [Calditrichaceae bacterium]|nr:HD domain-containing protein [Calditrichaceae bacterium]MBN2709985.1 HD domain-containing protein [Calditrichaceae bacterium]RQV97324.1 MAG: HD domain-containing protein [Calditrichota bacterium]